MAAPDIGSCLSAGIDGLKKHPLEHILAVVLVGAVGGVSAGVLSGPMVVGYMRMIERQERGEKVEFTDVFKGFDDFVPALLAVLLSSLIVSVGFMLCFLPGLLIVGLVPTAAYYDRRWGPGRWRSGLLLNLAIGQGELLLTPLQMALVAAEVASQGRPLRPHLVQRVGRGQLFRPERPVQPGITADPAMWGAVREAMELAVSAGTGGGARVPGVRVAGKTGTAQNPHGQDHALFVCFAPADSPVVAVAVVVENAGHGGSVAAPRAGVLLRRMFLPDSLQRPAAPRAAAAAAPTAPPDSEVVEGD